MTLRVSLGLPTHRVEAGPDLVSGAAIAALARAAEDAGFAAVFVTDHPAPPQAWVDRGGHHTLDPLVALAFAAAATTRLRVQTNLLVPVYRHPLAVAKAVATLDVLSGGRVVLGVGAGYLQEEFAALGVDFDRRNELLDDAIRTMTRAWADGVVDGVAAQPQPVQRPRPPIWVGGNSRRALARVVALGDGWVPMPSPQSAARMLRTPGLESHDDLRARIELLRQLADQAGRTDPIDIVFMPSGLDMFSRARPPASAVLDEMHALEQLGVTWATVTLPGDTRAELLAEIDRFGRDVIAHHTS